MKSSSSPDELLQELGGCGRFQWLLTVSLHVIKIVACWSAYNLIFLSAAPPWICADELSSYNTLVPLNKTLLTFNTSLTSDNTTAPPFNTSLTSDNTTAPPLNTSVAAYNTSYNILKNGTLIAKAKMCSYPDGNPCKNKVFDSNMKTIVSEFGLVCDKRHIPSTIMSVQMAGTMVAGVISGHIADMFGRKVPLLASLGMLIVFNVAGFFANSWILMMVVMACIGISADFFVVTHNSLLSEFTLSEWRPWVISFPSWSIEASLFALVAWLLKDGKYVQLTCAVLAVPCLIALWFIPESFRWYLSRGRPDDAQRVIKTVAKINRHPVADLECSHTVPDTAKRDRKYSVFHLVNTKHMIRVTSLVAFVWMSLGLMGFGISFGIQALSGNFYLNLFLFNFTSIPTKVMATWLQNKIGRRRCGILCCMFTATAGFVVGIVQHIDTPHKGVVTNVFAIMANMGVFMTWLPLQTMTIEVYPTVIRSIGFGCLSTLSRLGAVIGPQLVYLERKTPAPGLLYFVCGTLALLSIGCLFFLPETRGEDLADNLQGDAKDAETPLDNNVTTDDPKEKEVLLD